MLKSNHADNLTRLVIALIGKMVSTPTEEALDEVVKLAGTTYDKIITEAEIHE